MFIIGSKPVRCFRKAFLISDDAMTVVPEGAAVKKISGGIMGTSNPYFSRGSRQTLCEVC
ncbi:hypothetical protein SBV1_2010019 [Verrucomicrobia bacterium]|nr:hypothetical protein SBV1_2010019 [Verrucomicrobiota bacterium]